MIWLFVAGLFGLVAIHELGHLLMARAWGLKENEIGVGFGPVLFRKNRISLRAFPLGGYVLLPPFRSAAEAFWVAVAGPIANFAVAFFLVLAGVFKAGVPVEGGFSQAVAFAHPEKAVAFAAKAFSSMVAKTAAGLKYIFAEPLSIAGPVGIVKESAPFLRSDPWNILILLAFCSISMGLFNLLPWPGLDGAQALVRKLPEKMRKPCEAFGLRALLCMAIVLMIKDILR